MRNDAAARRSRWLRRTRVITGWVAALGAAATLLIAAVVGSASPARKVTVAVIAPRHRSLAARTPTRRPAVHHRVVAHRRTVVHHRARRHAAPTVPVQAPAPAPAPPPPPVVVSGGS